MIHLLQQTGANSRRMAVLAVQHSGSFPCCAGTGCGFNPASAEPARLRPTPRAPYTPRAPATLVFGVRVPAARFTPTFAPPFVALFPQNQGHGHLVVGPPLRPAAPPSGGGACRSLVNLESLLPVSSWSGSPAPSMSSIPPRSQSRISTQSGLSRPNRRAF